MLYLLPPPLPRRSDRGAVRVGELCVDGKQLFQRVPVAGERFGPVIAAHRSVQFFVRLEERTRGRLNRPRAQAAWLARYDATVMIEAMKGIDCIAALKALGELNRLRIMRLLLKKQLGVNTISVRLEMSQYNVSKHLRILREAGLLEMQKQGQQRLYAVVPRLRSHLAASRNVLNLGCCTFRFDKLPK
jgi:DNA-binding transcriptional ArsR family regulator